MKYILWYLNRISFLQNWRHVFHLSLLWHSLPYKHLNLLSLSEFRNCILRGMGFNRDFNFVTGMTLFCFSGITEVKWFHFRETLHKFGWSAGSPFLVSPIAFPKSGYGTETFQWHLHARYPLFLRSKYLKTFQTSSADVPINTTYDFKILITITGVNSLTN